MAHPLAIDSLDLHTHDDEGKPRETRLRDVSAALGIYHQLLRDDEKRALSRSRIDAMFDGAPPYDQSKLDASGQHLKTNLNFGEGQRYLDIAMSAYVDLYSSLERLVEVPVSDNSPYSEPATRNRVEALLSDEITRLLRSCPDFHSLYLRLCTTFIKHGVGITFFDSPDTWKFRVGGLANLHVPQQSEANEEGLDIAVARREYQLHELHHYISNEKAAKKAGWDVNEVKRVMLKNASFLRSSTNGRSFTDFEELQAEIKNNDLYTGIRNQTIEVVHFYVKELSGKVSHFICASEDPDTFMFRKLERFDNASQAFIFFTLGVGTNGTLHSIRGLGHRIFAHVQTSNRLRCQHIDGAMLGSSVMLQPTSQRALDELQFTTYGPYSVMSPNVQIVDKAIPNLATAVQPALQDLDAQLQRNVDTVSTYGPNQASPYRNQMQVVQDIDVSTRLSGASLNLFYASWSRLLREVVRRLVANKGVTARDPKVKAFRERLKSFGFDPDNLLRAVDLEEVRAVRSVGNGSKADRSVALRELMGISSSFDETGRRNLTRDIVASRVGYELADRYILADNRDRPVVDAKIAFLENGSLDQGKQVPVAENELHGTHLQTHGQALQQLIEALNTGQADPQAALPSVQAYFTHINGHLQVAGNDPALQGLVASTRQLLQYAEEVINNTTKAIEAQQRKAAEQGAQGNPEQGGPQMSPEDGAKMQKHQIEMRIKQEKAELDMELQRRKFEQEQAQRDAKAAMEFRENSGVAPESLLPASMSEEEMFPQQPI